MGTKLSDLIWYEKYRPTDMDDLILPSNHKKAIKKFTKKLEIPHLLFFGPPGSGKTTIAMILINSVASARLILNASSEDRGIDTIKKRVKQFASSKKGGRLLNVVFFDEADGLTPDAQRALKNLIETYHKNCRFIFTCNEITKITDPILSRCMSFHFNTVSKEVLMSHIENILERENIKYKVRDIKKIINYSYPDIRATINDIELCSIGGKLDIKMLSKIFNIKTLKSFKKCIQKGKLFALRNMWAGTGDFTWLYRYLFNIFLPEVKGDEKKEMAIIIAEYLYRDRTVADKEINMAACCIEIMNLLGTEIDFKKPY